MKNLIVTCVTALCAVMVPSHLYASPIFFGPTPYLSSADIPAGFFAGAFSLETFEDNSLDFGLVASGVSPFILGPGFTTDSVDADDGSIDGNGNNGHSFVANDTPGVTFTLPGLPTAAALVWTDGAGSRFSTTFEAFGPGMVSLGTIVVAVGDPFIFTGQTAEDRFFGVQDAGGILAIRIATPGAAQIETDHIMFGAAPNDANQVPEPSTLVLVGLGALRLVRQRSKTRSV